MWQKKSHKRNACNEIVPPQACVYLKSLSVAMPYRALCCKARTYIKHSFACLLSNNMISNSAVHAAQVDAKLVKQLRESSGAGMMDCKKALANNDNNLEKATEFLRKKGLASADKKAGRVASEGAIGSYVHAGSK